MQQLVNHSCLQKFSIKTVKFEPSVSQSRHDEPYLLQVDDTSRRVANLERQLATAKEALRLCQHELEATQDELAASQKLIKEAEDKLGRSQASASVRSLELSRQLMAELVDKERKMVELEEQCLQLKGELSVRDRLPDVEANKKLTDSEQTIELLTAIITGVDEAKRDLEYARRENILFGALFDTELSSYHDKASFQN